MDISYTKHVFKLTIHSLEINITKLSMHVAWTFSIGSGSVCFCAEHWQKQPIIESCMWGELSVNPSSLLQYWSQGPGNVSMKRLGFNSSVQSPYYSSSHRYGFIILKVIPVVQLYSVCCKKGSILHRKYVLHYKIELDFRTLSVADTGFSRTGGVGFLYWITRYILDIRKHWLL